MEISHLVLEEIRHLCHHLHVSKDLHLLYLCLVEEEIHVLETLCLFLLHLLDPILPAFSVLYLSILQNLASRQIPLQIWVHHHEVHPEVHHLDDLHLHHFANCETADESLVPFLFLWPTSLQFPSPSPFSSSQ